MAQQDYSGVITLAVIAGAAWYAYEQGWLSSLFGTAAATTTGTPAAAINCPSPNTLIAGVCTAPVSCPSPNTMINGVCTAPVSNTSTPAVPATVPLDQMLELANSSGQTTLNASQWDYYYQSLSGRQAVPPSTFSQMLTNAGYTSDQLITADQYVAMLNTVGLSGLGNYHGIPVHAIHGGW